MPKHVDIAVDKWWKLVGKVAELCSAYTHGLLNFLLNAKLYSFSNTTYSLKNSAYTHPQNNLFKINFLSLCTFSPCSISTTKLNKGL